MKKITLIVLSVVLIGSLGFSAGEKIAEESKMNIFYDLGLATADYKGLFMETGFQYGLTRNFFCEFLFEYYFKPVNFEFANRAYGFNLNSVYKFKAANNIKIFFKGGISLDSESVPFTGYSISTSAIGINAGAGLEFTLSKKLGIRAGSTFKNLFFKENETIFKFYGGFYYGL